MRLRDRYAVFEAFFIAIIFTVISGCNDSQDKLDYADQLETLCIQYANPAASLALFDSVGARYYNYGIEADGDPVTENTIYEAASLGKMILAHLYYNQFGSATVDIDWSIGSDSTAQCLAELDINLNHGDSLFIGSLMIRDLLTHCSGLPSYLSKRRIKKAFEYSEEGYALLQYWLEERIEQSITEYHSSIHYDSSFHFVWQEEMAAHIVHGYIFNGFLDREMNPYKKAQASGSLLSSVKGFHKQVDSFNDCFIDYIQSYCVAASPLYPSISGGLGLGIENTEKGNYIWHWGNNYSYNSFYVWDHSRKKGLILFVNSISGRKMFQEIIQGYFEDKDIRMVQFVWE